MEFPHLFIKRDGNRSICTVFITGKLKGKTHTSYSSLNGSSSNFASLTYFAKSLVFTIVALASVGRVVTTKSDKYNNSYHGNGSYNDTLYFI